MSLTPRPTAGAPYPVFADATSPRPRSGVFPALVKVVGESPHEANQIRYLLLAPCIENGVSYPGPGHVHLVSERATFVRNHGLTDPLVLCPWLPAYEAQRFQLGHLPAHRGVVAPYRIGQFDDTDRALALNSHQKRKKRPVQGYACFSNDRRIPLGAVHLCKDAEQRRMKLLQLT